MYEEPCIKFVTCFTIALDSLLPTYRKYINELYVRHTYHEDFDCRVIQIVLLDGKIVWERFASIDWRSFDEIRAELSKHRLLLVTLPLKRFVSKITQFIYLRKHLADLEISAYLL